ncbi:MAG TPA: hypothetical protein VNT03_01730 [Baekduia sp.]|nr:hypothetical protein [Baekduia sp.]
MKRIGLPGGMSWESSAECDRLTAEAQALIAGGAELLVLCTTTTHKVADAIAAAIDVSVVGGRSTDC